MLVRMVDMSPTVGRVFGIPIQLHWTFIMLLLVSLIYPAFFLYILLLFAFVVVHELSHSIAAKRNNISVKKIILYPLGGGSMIDLSGADPRLEFRIALAGPVSNFLMAAVLGIPAILTHAGFAHTIIQVLFLVNVFLGVLNIIPAFPLDGGRILRSYLQRTRTSFEATRKTVMVSNATAGISVVLAIAFLFVGDYTGLYRMIITVSLLILGFYIYGGAQAEMYLSRIKSVVDDIPLSRVMSKSYVKVNERTTIPHLYSMIQKKHTNLIIFPSNGGYKMVSKIPSRMFGASRKGHAEPTLSEFSISIPVSPYKAGTSGALNMMDMEGAKEVAITRYGRLSGIVTRPFLEYIVSLHISAMNAKHNKH